MCGSSSSLFYVNRYIFGREDKQQKQFTKNRLASELRPDLLGELERSPRPFSRKTGGLLLRGGEGKEIGGEERGERGW